MGKKETAVEKMRRKMEQKESQEDTESDNENVVTDNDIHINPSPNIDTDDTDTIYSDEQDVDIEQSLETDTDLGSIDTSTSLDYKIKNKTEKYDKSLIHQAINQGIKNPRVGAWSPTSAIILNYIKFTRPRYGKSISSEIDEILADGLKERYPELHEAIENELREKNQDIPKVKGVKK
ncbi:hypothetical protein Metev_2379 (plasmid) [Methanohalobium evestigatum Z-7303]|uniref:Uncharacterized protein n=1 Tax=Methanohalobium evestigatum (strain ATCC BAA-1072 / DSM 3721 / NBRC 107634 / OCM 161 / Z-7303) TaxID=644295 RepID=D7EC64_METEZ|nr:hypothetical protein [Methanohalobium evestigatum]ADI75186.1 hypothetical protein Metev_2379 [Methanohalobium evestigatum Z-7303]